MDYCEMADAIRRRERAFFQRRRRLINRTFLASSAIVLVAVSLVERFFF